MRDGGAKRSSEEGNEAASAALPVAARDLTKVYGAVTAVDRISFTIEAGTTVALLGGNGAGKTTTISMLLGLVVPTAGEVRVFGADMSNNRYQVAHRLNFQSPYVDMPMRLTVRQNLTVYAGLYGIVNVEERVAYIAVPLLDRQTGKLSAGQKTRVGLAKALLNAPDLLLLDEPTASLDPDTADWIRQKLQSYGRSKGATILLASHNMAEVERLANRVILLEAGRIVEDGPPQHLVKAYGRKTLEEVFLHIVRNKEGARREGARNDSATHAAVIAAAETETEAAP
jgi:ABC-2 type transport system ATP-binding protein